MISILIPIFNYDVNILVNDLLNQLNQLNIDYEIILGDDGSDEEFRQKNRKLSNFKKIIYYEEPLNIGRSAIRNKLANLASYNNLIFIDCDMSLEKNSNYIQNYLNYIDFNGVVCGGYSYESKCHEPNYILRWKYGIKREALPAKIRNKKKYIHFLTGNFMIKKSFFFNIRFDEKLKCYGYEDTLFAFNLMKSNIPILHIDNETLHNVQIYNNVFIEKSELALKNLLVIFNSLNDKDFVYKIKILKYCVLLKKFKLNKIFLFFFKFFKNIIYNALVNSKNPSIILFDIYRLGYLCELNIGK